MQNSNENFRVYLNDGGDFVTLYVLSIFFKIFVSTEKKT